MVLHQPSHTQLPNKPRNCFHLNPFGLKFKGVFYLVPMRTLFFSYFFFFFSFASSAQVVVNSGLTESVFITPGGSQTLTVTLKNNDTQPRRVTFDLSDYVNDCEEGYIYIDSIDTKNSCLPWIELENEELILTPGEEREFLLQLTVPPTFTGPSAKTCLFVNNAALIDSVQEEGILQFGVQIRYGINILYTNPKANSEIDLYAQKLSIDTVAFQTLAKVSILNRGNASTNFTSKIDIIDKTGEVVRSNTTKKQTIQPQQCRTVSINIKDLSGTYEILVVNETSDGQLFGFTDVLNL